MNRQMCWLIKDGSYARELYVRESSLSPWVHYSRSPFKVPDQGKSKGWSTFQSLLKQGWEVVVDT
ncbi:MAG: hypothetical protein F6J86_38395 [Symploca sp. SIO1B1]|nr:hypothetical protein [Symploca sp. SIO1B1]